MSGDHLLLEQLGMKGMVKMYVCSVAVVVSYLGLKEKIAFNP